MTKPEIKKRREDLAEKLASLYHNTESTMADISHGCWSADKCYNTAIVVWDAAAKLYEAREKILVDAIQGAVKYLTSCGYDKIKADRPPETYMLADLRAALEKVGVK